MPEASFGPEFPGGCSPLRSLRGKGEGLLHSAGELCSHLTWQGLAGLCLRKPKEQSPRLGSARPWQGCIRGEPMPRGPFSWEDHLLLGLKDIRWEARGGGAAQGP